MDNSFKKLYEELHLIWDEFGIPYNKRRKLILVEIEMISLLITYKDRIFVPKEMRNRTLTWYHHYLCHPGRDRMYKTIAATLYWDNMETDVSKFIKTCSTCQRFKKRKKKYVKLPHKEVTMTP